MIANTISNKKLNKIVTELYFRERKLNISIVFIKKLDFALPKEVTISYTHFCIMKVSNRQELQKISIYHSLDIDFEDVNDSTLASGNLSDFRRNLLERT